MTELLELTASGLPQRLSFQLDVVMKSPARSALYELAAVFDVPHDQVGQAVFRACKDLDRLERQRGRWRDPAKILDSPNLAALRHVCHARLNRVSKLARQHRLERILQRVEQAYELARSRAWIEAFIGEVAPEKQHTAGGESKTAGKPSRGR
ncbi:MAG: hypothetical protein GY719_38475 [bacterium]|nr:hypothetical protein [bacterium]